jgi:hypothetical protein
LPYKEAFVNSAALPIKAIIHNVRNRKAHHDIILPSTKNGRRQFIPVSVKASFEFKSGKPVALQQQVSKENASVVPLLIWLFLGSHGRKEEKYESTTAFLNGGGCCGGLALAKFTSLKKVLASKTDKLA